MRVALITGNYGSYDPVRPLPEWHGFDDAVLVTNHRDIATEGWRVHLDPRDEPPRLAAKHPKMNPWNYTDCDAALWVDASIEITSPLLRPWAAAHLKRDDLVIWSHPEGRICLEQEAEVCWNFPKYADQPIREQAAAYLAAGMPRYWGLFAAGVIAWRFTPEARAFGEAWLAEQYTGTIQDQISLPYLLWENGKQFGVWNANQYDNPYIRIRWDERPDPQK